MTNTIKTILVTGSTGQLGQSLQSIESEFPQYAITFATRQELDLSKSNTINDFFKKNKFDVIINCAAHTAVDKAESEPELANQINHLAVKQLAEIASKQKSKLIHVSTDYVFNGQQHRPYTESDKVNPQGVYGQTKLDGEKVIQSILKQHAIIIRTSWVYSEYGHNFVKTMMRLGQERDELNVIFDQVGTPTYALDLAIAIMDIVQSELFYQADFETKVVHFSNEGVCSWYDFAKNIIELSQIDCKVSPIETKDYPTPAIRPHYSVLNKTKIKTDYQLTIPYWKDSLVKCVKVLQEQQK